MSIRDANELSSNSVLNTDICIVGAGAAGITLAQELNGSPRSICLVESGSYNPDEEAQSLCDVEIAGYPVRENFMARARYFGGTCNLWAGRSMKLTEFDFEKREWVPDSGWPIAYSDVQNYYGKAAKILKLPSFESFENVTVKRGLSPAERALFNNTDLKPNISLWGIKPLRFGAAYKSRLARSRNVTVYLNANVTEIMLNSEGTSVAEVKIATLSETRVSLRAKIFILACGGMENARLLLVSRGVQRNGIGNQFDLVGRFFMDHPRTVFGKIRLAEKQRLPLLLAVPLRDGMGQIGIQLSESVQRKERLLNNYLSLERQWSPQAAKAYQSFVHSAKILLRRGYSGKRFTLSDVKLAKIPELIYLLAPRELMPHFLYRIFKAARRRFGKDISELIIVNYCEQAPNPASRVFLSEERDKLNMNRLVLDWKVGAEETRTVVRLQELLDQYLRKNNIGFLDTTPSEIDALSYTDASHHIGTTRMSAHPRSGVVDANCKVHGVQNLFMAGSSVFPTCGYANPTWTIVALALRLAEHLQKQAR
ncbi:MAG TPA: GMC family oxidoreductase [Candidatus Binatia bacterium]